MAGWAAGEARAAEEDSVVEGTGEAGWAAEGTAAVAMVVAGTAEGGQAVGATEAGGLGGLEVVERAGAATAGLEGGWDATANQAPSC
ncbi:MAG: hypothetical protein VKK05_09490 [Synechococcus sp.]|nr:hypothetical protein [Synechococcus sp.]